MLIFEMKKVYVVCLLKKVLHPLPWNRACEHRLSRRSCPHPKAGKPWKSTRKMGRLLSRRCRLTRRVNRILWIARFGCGRFSQDLLLRKPQLYKAISNLCSWGETRPVHVRRFRMMKNSWVADYFGSLFCAIELHPSKKWRAFAEVLLLDNKVNWLLFWPRRPPRTLLALRFRRSARRPWQCSSNLYGGLRGTILSLSMGSTKYCPPISAGNFAGGFDNHPLCKLLNGFLLSFYIEARSRCWRAFFHQHAFMRHTALAPTHHSKLRLPPIIHLVMYMSSCFAWSVYSLLNVILVALEFVLCLRHGGLPSKYNILGASLWPSQFHRSPWWRYYSCPWRNRNACYIFKITPFNQILWIAQAIVRAP